MKSNMLIQKMKRDIIKVSVSLSIDSIDSLFQDKELDYLLDINTWLECIIEQKIKHMSLFGDKLNSLKKKINIFKKNNDKNIEPTMYSYEILLDIMIIKAEQLSILQEKKKLIGSMITFKTNTDLNSSLEIIVLTN